MSAPPRVCQHCGAENPSRAVTCASCRRSFRPTALGVVCILGMLGAVLVTGYGALSIVRAMASLYEGGTGLPIARAAHSALAGVGRVAEAPMLFLVAISGLVGLADICLGLWSLHLLNGLRSGSAAAWRGIHQLWVILIALEAFFGMLSLLGLVFAAGDSDPSDVVSIYARYFLLVFLYRVLVIAAFWWYLSTPAVKRFCNLSPAMSTEATV